MLTIIAAMLLFADPAPAISTEQLLREYETSREADVIASREIMKNKNANSRDKTAALLALMRGDKIKPGYIIYVPIFRELRTGTVGCFGEYSLGFKVLQVLDADSAVFEFTDLKHTPFIVSGINTSRLKTDTVEKIAGEYRIAGSKEYTDSKGEKRSALHFSPIELRKFLKTHHPIYSQVPAAAKTPIKPKTSAKKARAN